MKKLAWIAIFSLLILLTGCGDKDKSTTAPTSDVAVVAETHTALIYTNMSAGSENPDLQQYTLEYTGDLTPEVLAEGLSQLTGLDFFLSSSPIEDGLFIDWAADSTLIANLDDREQNPDFHFYDSDSLRWFMMDSLWLTLMENLSVSEIYYTMEGGQDLVFEALYPVQNFPAEIPYMGSAFFFAHADGQGNIQDGKGDLLP